MPTFRRYLSLLRPHRARLALAIVFMLLNAISTTLSFTMVEPFTKLLFATVSGDAVAAPAPLPLPDFVPGAHAIAGLAADWNHWLFDTRRIVGFERLCFVILGLFFVKNVSEYLSSFLSVSVEQAMLRDLRGIVFAHLQRLSLSFYHGKRTGALISQVTNDVDIMRQIIAAGISNLLKDGLTLVGCLVIVFLSSWKLALLSMLVLPPAGWMLAVIGRKVRSRSGRTQERMADLTGILQESIMGARVVKAFGMEGFEQSRFEKANQGYFASFVRMRRVASAAKPISEYAMILLAVGIAWVGAREIFEHQSLPPGRFLQFVTALLGIIGPVKSLSELNNSIAAGLGASDRVFRLLDTEPTISDRPDARDLPPLTDAVRFEKVGFSYDTGDPVLRDVDFEVKRGEVVALVGASGAGKSTTLDLLGRFYEPTSGRITFDGIDLRDARTSSLRRQLGIVTQETILFHDSVRANIAYGLPDVPMERVREAARAANAHTFIEKLPEGYDTVIGDRGVRLSGGERQRLAIARALLKNPPLLLLDEATSALDTENERLVQEALERLMRERTVFVIAHRLSTVQHANRILVFEGGRIVESGTHAELLAAGGAYRRLHDLQFRD
ncbi:MAG: ABC transporter ATP-binding protein [Candidatus Eisenbacteria bacterium]|uniref:ABC transporter ATP-binding protein n=1 Tax=Eiseniibacteriota bacterium TaxID=2212470 RepID=A0A933SBW9_UNCEI|nr:ABC transporter ATP-binding protein [Candidatus Eisenbacteria bacterium]